jgi:hypothetical protein
MVGSEVSHGSVVYTSEKISGSDHKNMSFYLLNSERRMAFFFKRIANGEWRTAFFFSEQRSSSSE